MVTPDDHERIERLIPWYVNGTLNEAEMDAVNEHLQGCAACTENLEREVCYARDLGADPPDLQLMGSPQRGWQTLVDRLPRHQRLTRRTTTLLTLASVILAVGAGALLLNQQLQRPVYRTMTSSPRYDGPVVQVVFEPSTPEHVIRGVVLESGGTLVAGPTAAGIYRIGLPSASDGAAVAERLQTLPSVRWASLEEP